MRSLEEVIEYDEDGRVDGLQFDGRERSLQLWQEKQEAKEFASLVDRLYKRNYARRITQTEAGRERLRNNLRRYRDRNRERLRQRCNELRRAKYEADPIVNKCRVCGVEWSPSYDQKGMKRARFCSRRCRNRYHGKRRKRSRGIRQMDCRKRVMAALQDGPLTTRQVSVAAGCKFGSVATLLCVMRQCGDVLSDGCFPARYWLPRA